MCRGSKIYRREIRYRDRQMDFPPPFPWDVIIPSTPPGLFSGTEVEIYCIFPPEIWCVLFSFCDLVSLRTLSQASPQFFSVLSDPCFVSFYLDRNLVCRQDQEPYSFHHEMVGVKYGLAREKCGHYFYEGNYVDGKRQGFWRSLWDIGGDVYSYGCYDDDVLSGPWNFLSSGKVIRSLNYLDGEIHGTFQTYFSDGITREERNYNRGTVDGNVRLYYSSGSIAEEIAYSDGNCSGPYFRYYEIYSGSPSIDGYIRGPRKECGQFFRHSKVGTWEYFSLDGKLLSSLNYSLTPLLL